MMETNLLLVVVLLLNKELKTLKMLLFCLNLNLRPIFVSV